MSWLVGSWIHPSIWWSFCWAWSRPLDLLEGSPGQRRGGRRTNVRSGTVCHAMNLGIAAVLRAEDYGWKNTRNGVEMTSISHIISPCYWFQRLKNAWSGNCSCGNIRGHFTLISHPKNDGTHSNISKQNIPKSWEGISHVAVHDSPWRLQIKSALEVTKFQHRYTHRPSNSTLTAVRSLTPRIMRSSIWSTLQTWSKHLKRMNALIGRCILVLWCIM